MQSLVDIGKRNLFPVAMILAVPCRDYVTRVGVMWWQRYYVEATPVLCFAAGSGGY